LKFGNGRRVWPSGVAFSPDGRRLAAAVRHPDADSMPCPFVVWDLGTGAEVLRCDGHKGGVLGVAWNGDGRFLVSGGIDRTAVVWDAGSGVALRTLTGHTDPVTAVAWVDGRLATASLDRTARLWDAETGRELAVYAGHTAPVVAASLSGDGTRLATASWDGTVRIWDREGRPRRQFLGHTAWPRAVSISRDGRLLASCGDDALVKLWDADGSAPHVLEIKAEADWIPCLAFHPEGQRLISCGEGRLKAWNPATGKLLHDFSPGTFEIMAVAFSPDGRLLAGVGEGAGSGSGTRRPAVASSTWPATARTSWPWRSAPTAAPWRRPARMAPCDSGTPPTAGPGEFFSATSGK
jgi:WD40 repeat protein